MLDPLEVVRQEIAAVAGRADAESTLEALNNSISELAWHRENVAKSRDPELDFGGED